MAKKKTDDASKNGASASPELYFLSLSLENIRCFREKQTLDLSNGDGVPARWTILLGTNGTGKTTVLHSLALYFCHLRTWVPQLRKPNWLLRLQDTLPRTAHAASELHMTVSRSSVDTASAHPKAREFVFQFNHPSDDTHSYEDGVNIISEDQLPVVCGYGASRRLGTVDLGEDKEDSFGTLFSDTANLRNAEDWLLKLDYVASKPSPHQPRQAELRSLVTDLILHLLPEIEDIRFDPGQGGYPKPKVEFQTPYGWVPLRQLGYGYQTLIAWMVDLASRMVERYPDSPNPLAEPAIVLVDEIDLHLHPTWQRKLIPMLTERFPNTQFIATAHSPLIVQASGDANIALLRRDGDQVVIDNDVEKIKGWRIDQIYTSELFRLPSARPPELDGPLERRHELLMKSKLTAAEKKELEALNAQVMSMPGGETPEQTETMRLLRETLETLKKEKTPTP